MIIQFEHLDIIFYNNENVETSNKVQIKTGDTI